MSESIYPFEDFLRHYKQSGVLLGVPDTSRLPVVSFDNCLGNVIQYMKGQYRDHETMTVATIAFIQIHVYLVQHGERFESEGLAAIGVRDDIASEHLLRAVHYVFTMNGRDELEDPPVEMVIKLAKQFESATAKLGRPRIGAEPAPGREYFSDF